MRNLLEQVLTKRYLSVRKLCNLPESRGRKPRRKSEKEGSCRSRGSQRRVTELSDLRSDNGGESKSIFELGEVDRMQRSISLHSRVGREGSQKVIFTTSYTIVTS